jgi:hypothetical protein
VNNELDPCAATISPRNELDSPAATTTSLSKLNFTAAITSPTNLDSLAATTLPDV